jgi:DNA-binding HxlR family transcriptional regulator
MGTLINGNCPVEVALNKIGGKYKVLILHFLIDGPLRFNELQKAIPRATPKMLTQQLRELEADGLIHRKVYPVVPPRTDYSLTDLGSSLIPILASIAEWGSQFL